jgi:cytidylate kinase
MEHLKKIIVAIDGFSSCGKSTMAKKLAQTVGYIYVDSGAMYRGVTLFALRKGFFRDETVDAEPLRTAIDTMINISFEYDPANEQTYTYLNGENVEAEIRNMEVANRVSRIAALDFVRRALVLKQQALGQSKGIVMDGRDIGTVVFPEAELKIFVTASAEIRARRRLDELRAKGRRDVSFDEVLANVLQRDQMDMTRTESPLRKAADAIELDNTHLTIPEQEAWLLDQFYRAVVRK